MGNGVHLASLWALATVLALLFAGIAYGFSGYALSATETVVELFKVLGMVLAFLLPIVALVATYMAIAGERESGGVKFLLGLPNSRRDVFLGKLASRLGVVTAGVAIITSSAGHRPLRSMRLNSTWASTARMPSDRVDRICGCW